MTDDRIEGNWKEMKGRARQKWGRLTDDDLELLQGKADELVGKIEKAYGKTRDQARREVEEFLR